MMVPREPNPRTVHAQYPHLSNWRASTDWDHCNGQDGRDGVGFMNRQPMDARQNLVRLRAHTSPEGASLMVRRREADLGLSLASPI